jgi:hypothetical protein
MATAISGTNDDLITGGELLFTEGARLPQKSGGFADVVGANHWFSKAGKVQSVARG